MKLTISKQRSRQGIITHWIFRCNWQCQGKDPRQGIITCWGFRCNWQCQSKDLRLGIFTCWIFRGDWQCQGKDPRQEIITCWSSDSIDNVKAKIQDKGLSPVDLQIQLTMSRQRFKTRHFHLLIFRFNWQCQGTDPRQGIITRWSSDWIDNVKAKIQDKGLSPIDLQIQLTMSRQRSVKNRIVERVVGWRSIEVIYWRVVTKSGQSRSRSWSLNEITIRRQFGFSLCAAPPESFLCLNLREVE